MKKIDRPKAGELLMFPVAAAALYDYATKGGPADLRDTLPEPIDYFDHGGFAAISLLPGRFATIFTARQILKRNPEQTVERSTTIASRAVVALTTAASFATELMFTKHGIPTTGIDTMYALGGATIGAMSVGPENVSPQHVQPAPEQQTPPPTA